MPALLKQRKQFSAFYSIAQLHFHCNPKQLAELSLEGDSGVTQCIWSGNVTRKNI
jgi:hypothetical protein